MSVCSQPGMAWITDKVSLPGVRESILRFAKDMTCRLKTEVNLSKDRVPEPSAKTAWRYTTGMLSLPRVTLNLADKGTSIVFFEHASEAAMGILEQSWFKTRLQLHFAEPKRGFDASWYALRNIVFAFGCRIEMAKTASYSDAARVSIGLFENALSVQTDMLHLHSTLMSVKALILMVGPASNILSV